MKKTKSWNNTTYVQFRNSNSLSLFDSEKGRFDDSMSVSTIGMRSVSSSQRPRQLAIIHLPQAPLCPAGRDLQAPERVSQETAKCRKGLK